MGPGWGSELQILVLKGEGSSQEPVAGAQDPVEPGHQG